MVDILSFEQTLLNKIQRRNITRDIRSGHVLCVMTNNLYHIAIYSKKPRCLRSSSSCDWHWFASARTPAGRGARYAWTACPSELRRCRYEDQVDVPIRRADLRRVRCRFA